MTCINSSSTWAIWWTHKYLIVMDMGFALGRVRPTHDVAFDCQEKPLCLRGHDGWSVPQPGQATTALLTPEGRSTSNRAPHAVQVWRTKTGGAVAGGASDGEATAGGFCLCSGLSRRSRRGGKSSGACRFGQATEAAGDASVSGSETLGAASVSQEARRRVLQALPSHRPSMRSADRWKHPWMWEQEPNHPRRGRRLRRRQRCLLERGGLGRTQEGQRP